MEAAGENVDEHIKLQVTPRRWFSLFVFFGVVFNNAFQWVNYVMVPDIMCEYFNIEVGEVNIYFVLTTYLVESKGELFVLRSFPAYRFNPFSPLRSLIGWK